MLFGSVPSPPGTPKSCTSAQSATQNTMAAGTATRSTRGRAVTNARPNRPSAMTANRFTANPCLVSNDANADTILACACGWVVPAIACTMAVSVPELPPCQKPRPGHAWSSAMPVKKTPVTGKMNRQTRNGSATSAPAAT